MHTSLKTTLKAFPVITAIAVALCYITTALADSLFNIKLDDQASLEQVRLAIKWLVGRLCGNAGWHWYLFKDLGSLLVILGQLIVLAPLLEEVLFRWILYRLPRPARPIVPAITSSILFSAAHYIQMPWPNNAFIALFFFGMAQCWLYEKTNSLWCPILNHALFNTVNLVLLFAIPS